MNTKIINTIYILITFLSYSLTVKAQDSTLNSSNKGPDAFVQIIQDPQIEIINNYYKQARSSDTLVDGYRIQIYFGSRNKAIKRKAEFEEIFIDTKVSIIYEEPNFKTVVGGYSTKLDADRELRKFREDFSDAFIIRNKIKRE